MKNPSEKAACAKIPCGTRVRCSLGVGVLVRMDNYGSPIIALDNGVEVYGDQVQVLSAADECKIQVPECSVGTYWIRYLGAPFAPGVKLSSVAMPATIGFMWLRVPSGLTKLVHTAWVTGKEYRPKRTETNRILGEQLQKLTYGCVEYTCGQRVRVVSAEAHAIHYLVEALYGVIKSFFMVGTNIFVTVVTDLGLYLEVHLGDVSPL